MSLYQGSFDPKDYEQMIKESQELQAFCQAAKTPEAAMECYRRSQEF